MGLTYGVMLTFTACSTITRFRMARSI